MWRLIFGLFAIAFWVIALSPTRQAANELVADGRCSASVLTDVSASLT